MGKTPNEYPRFVTYFNDEEAAQIRQRASKSKLTKPQKWIVALVRRELKKGR